MLIALEEAEALPPPDAQASAAAAGQPGSREALQKGRGQQQMRRWAGAWAEDDRSRPWPALQPRQAQQPSRAGPGSRKGTAGAAATAGLDPAPLQASNAAATCLASQLGSQQISRGCKTQLPAANPPEAVAVAICSLTAVDRAELSAFDWPGQHLSAAWAKAAAEAEAKALAMAVAVPLALAQPEQPGEDCTSAAAFANAVACGANRA